MGALPNGRYSDLSEWQRSVSDAAVRGKETAGYHKRAVSDAAAPSGNEATAAGGGNKEPSEWQRSIKSRESASPKILSGTATGTESTGHRNSKPKGLPSLLAAGCPLRSLDCARDDIP